jgi:hypothetical protein
VVVRGPIYWRSGNTIPLSTCLDSQDCGASLSGSQLSNARSRLHTKVAQNPYRGLPSTSLFLFLTLMSSSKNHLILDMAWGWFARICSLHSTCSYNGDTAVAMDLCMVDKLVDRPIKVKFPCLVALCHDTGTSALASDS